MKTERTSGPSQPATYEMGAGLHKVDENETWQPYWREPSQMKRNQSKKVKNLSGPNEHPRLQPSPSCACGRVMGNGNVF